MNILFKLASRNIIRNARRNLFTILSIASGLAFMFWVQCIFIGHERNMISTITSTFTGDVQIHKKKYLEERLLQENFVPSEALNKNINALNVAWTKRVYFPGIVSSGDLSYPVILVGIDPENEAKITHLKSDMKSGEYLQSAQGCPEAPILLSESLSKKLFSEINDKIVILGQDANGSLGNQLFHVKGLFNTNSRDFDKLYAYTTVECAQQIASIEGVHEILMKTGNDLIEDVDTRSKVDAFIEPGLSTSTWKDIVLGVANLIRFNNAIRNLIAFVLFAVISLGVVNSMLMNIFERTREIGIMLALGTTPWQVRAIIVFESLLIAIIGASLGTLLGLLVISYHQRVGFDLTPFVGPGGVSGVGFSFPVRVIPIIEWEKFLRVVSLEILFIVIAGLYPAFKASRLKPTETIRG